MIGFASLKQMEQSCATKSRLPVELTKAEKIAKWGKSCLPATSFLKNRRLACQTDEIVLQIILAEVAHEQGCG